MTMLHKLANHTDYLRSSRQISAVFVASDDDNLTASKLKESFPDRPYRFISLDKHASGAEDEILEALRDFHVLSNVDAFLGTSGNWATPLMAVNFARRPDMPMDQLCVIITAVRGAPLACQGSSAIHQDVTHFFLPQDAHLIPRRPSTWPSALE